MEKQTLVKEICPTTTQTWLKNGALLVDVREKDEIEQLAFDVPDILIIPLSEFEERYTEIPKDKDVVMVCAVGSRSLRAAGFFGKSRLYKCGQYATWYYALGAKGISDKRRYYRSYRWGFLLFFFRLLLKSNRCSTGYNTLPTG